MANITPESIASNAIYAAELGLSLTRPNSDAVCVLNSDFEQVFPKARPMKIGVRQSIKAMEHPLENGEITTDYRVLNPIEIDLPVKTQGLYYRGVYHEIEQLYKNSTLLTVQTRTKNYRNMVITEMPHEQLPAEYDVISMNLRFKQFRIVQKEGDYEPASAADADLTILGYQLPSVYTILGTALGLATTAQAIAAQVR